MEFEEIKLLKQSEKSTVCLVRSNGQNYIRKVLAGQHPVYEVLRDNPHPGLPRLVEVNLSEASTSVLEEYIEGHSVGSVELSKKQFSAVAKELCSVLTFLHGKGILHRDIKPSNIILAKDGHVRLIDFDIARMPREGLDRDTQQLGTRGFAPPEQYGFTQTDERADIYALGITLTQLMTDRNRKPHYKKVLQRCTNLDPNKRYQTVGQFQRAFFPARRNLLSGCAAVCLCILMGICAWKLPAPPNASEAENGDADLTVLPIPENVHWKGESAIMVWDNVPESGTADEVWFHVRLYRRDTADAPDPEDEDWYYEETVRTGGKFKDASVIDSHNLAMLLEENGFYYFTVCAVGDGAQYTDSPYAVSNVFAYTGQSAPPLPAPEGLAWRLVEKDGRRYYFATWNNLDEYGDEEVFNATFYDETGAYVMNNYWSVSDIREYGYGGISIPAEFLVSGPGRRYRFTVQAYSSRPNEYSSSLLPDPTPEEYYSPWLDFGPPEETGSEETKTEVAAP